MKTPISVSGRVWARKNCMFGEIISKGGIEVTDFFNKGKKFKNEKIRSISIKNKSFKSWNFKIKKRG